MRESLLLQFGHLVAPSRVREAHPVHERDRVINRQREGALPASGRHLLLPMEYVPDRSYRPASPPSKHPTPLSTGFQKNVSGTGCAQRETKGSPIPLPCVVQE